MMGFGMGIFGGLFMLLFWVGIILLAVWLITLLFPSVSNSLRSSNLSAREILDQRYAKGEITKTEYDTMKKNLLG